MPSDAAPDAVVAEVADGGTAAPAAAPAAAPTIVETIVIELGGAAPGDGQIYVRVRGLMSILSGLLSNLPASARISSEKVAEKSSV